MRRSTGTDWRPNEVTLTRLSRLEARCMRRAIGVPQDDDEVASWYRLAAEQGDTSAKFER